MKFLNRLGLKLRFIIPAIAIAIGIILNSYAAIQFVKLRAFSSSSSPTPVTSQPTTEPTATATPEVLQPIESTPPEISTGAVSPDVSAPTPLLGEPKFGHFPYPQGDSEKMIIISSYAQSEEYQRFEKLAPEVALALMKMIYAARDDGVWIVPVSGFRTIESQESLFEAQIQRRGSAEVAAKFSAPPGYSEHHTGYAVDLGDGRFPKLDITYEFAETDAFRWLSERADGFGFELSFPENNPQGVSYEPWHWRFIGSPSAVKIFASAREQV